jgi:hypothetical protein
LATTATDAAKLVDAGGSTALRELVDALPTASGGRFAGRPSIVA